MALLHRVSSPPGRGIAGPPRQSPRSAQSLVPHQPRRHVNDAGSHEPLRRSANPAASTSPAQTTVRARRRGDARGRHPRDARSSCCSDRRGIIPTIYALVQSLQVRRVRASARAASRRIIGDFRFVDTFVHIFITLVVWLPLMMIGVVGLSLLVLLRARAASARRCASSTTSRVRSPASPTSCSGCSS